MKLYLDNCNLEPMSSYMKSLGIFRLLSEQKCEDIKGYWENNIFVLDANITKEEIIKFFLEGYAPSSVMSPWNRGNFLYLHKQHPKKKGDIYSTIMSQQSQRFNQIKLDIDNVYKTRTFSYRTERVSDFHNRFSGEIQNKSSKEKEKLTVVLNKINKNLNNDDKIVDIYTYDKDIKECVDVYEKRIIKTSEIIAEARGTMSDNFVEWLDTCLVLDTNLDKITAPLLGTGGNEGDLEYSTKFMQYIIMMLIKKENSCELLESAIFGTSTDKLKNEKIGKFYPGRSGGYNQGNSIENKDFDINPWDFILLIEGLFLWSNSISRKNSINARSYMLSPFSVKLFSAGYCSSQIPDKKSSETWLPVWNRPTHLVELKSLFSYGRVVYNGSYAKTGLEFLEAVKSLGVDKGITGFVRYVTHQRKGQGNFLSIPVSNISVGYDPKVLRLNKINRIIQKFTRAKLTNIPESHRELLNSISNAVFNFAANTSPYNAQRIVSVLGKMEIYSSIHRKEYGPLGQLQAEWIDYSNDNSPEFRIALSIASIRGDVGNIREQLEPVNKKYNDWVKDTWVTSWIGNDLPNKMANLIYRRLIKATQYGLKRIPLDSVFGATMQDISMFIDGNLDENKIENLILGLSMINWENQQRIHKIYTGYEGNLKKSDYPVNIKYAILKSAMMPDKNDAETVIESRIIPLLKSNRIRDAANIAQRRLLVNQNIYSNISVADGNCGTRLAGALLVPLSKHENLLETIFGQKLLEKEMMRNE